MIEQSAVQPDSQMLIGIQFEMDKNWHIYWQNPGDSGEPPQIRWQLPEGVTAGALRWPAPARLNTGAGTDYGYEGSVALLSTLRIPSAAQAGTTIELGGDLRWLVCHDVCIPQRSELKVPVHVASVAVIDPGAQAVLHAAAERIPQPLPAGFHARAASSPDNFLLTLASNQEIAQAEFFPAEPEQIDNSAPQRASNAGLTRLELRKSDHLQRDPLRLKGVIVINGKNSYELDVPIYHSAAQPRRRP